MAANRGVENVIEENPFAIDLHNFLGSYLNFAKGDIENPVQSYFNEDIGFAILYLQFITKDSLRAALGEIHIRTIEDAINVARKLCRVRRRKKPELVLQVFLESCAIIAEVYLYCGYGLHLLVESSTFILAWNFVFTRRRIKQLLACGGWRELTAYAKQNYGEKRGFVDEQIECLKDPYESSVTNPTHDPETQAMVADLEDSFQSLGRDKTRAINRERYRQSKEATRIRRIDERLIDDSEERTAAPEPSLASQTRSALRSHWRRLPAETEASVVAISDYATSDEGEDSDDDASPTVSELCTMMSETQIASERKKKRQRRKKKPSQKSTGQPDSTSPESASPGKAATSETFASSARPLKVPVQSPATSPTKSPETKGPKAVSSGSSKAGKKGKKN